MDDVGEYERLKTIHPLMAGRYFPNRWKLRSFVFEEVKSKAKDKEHQKKIKMKSEKEEEKVKISDDDEESSLDRDNQPVVSTTAT